MSPGSRMSETNETNETGDLPRPPARVPLDGAVASLRARLRYVKDTLNVPLEELAVAGGLSEKALRDFDDPDWNPRLNTLRLADEALARQVNRLRTARAHNPQGPILRARHERAQR